MLVRFGEDPQLSSHGLGRWAGAGKGRRGEAFSQASGRAVPAQGTGEVALPPPGPFWQRKPHTLRALVCRGQLRRPFEESRDPCRYSTYPCLCISPECSQPGPS